MQFTPRNGDALVVHVPAVRDGEVCSRSADTDPVPMPTAVTALRPRETELMVGQQLVQHLHCLHAVVVSVNLIPALPEVGVDLRPLLVAQLRLYAYRPPDVGPLAQPTERFVAARVWGYGLGLAVRVVIAAAELVREGLAMLRRAWLRRTLLSVRDDVRLGHRTVLDRRE
jgi:hypothetical protein